MMGTFNGHIIHDNLFLVDLLGCIYSTETCDVWCGKVLLSETEKYHAHLFHKTGAKERDE